MANQFDLQILNDGWRNAIVRISGILDSSDADLNPAVSLDNFINNDTSGYDFVGLRIDRIDNQIGDGLQVQLYWTATVDQLIHTMASVHETCLKAHGGLVPDMTALGYTGNIRLKTIGFNSFQVPPQSFSVILQMVKLYE